MEKIPLFPLGLVLLPQMMLPLHIFEERYKRMISECIAGDAPFGIVWFDGRSIRSAGCTARVTEVLQRYDDGRLDIMTRGEHRFFVKKFMEENAYMEGEVVFFDDEAASAAELHQAAEPARRTIQQWSEAENAPEVVDPASLADPKRLSFAIPSLEGFTPAERQRFLEMTSTPERLRKGRDALARMIERSRLTLAIQKIIGGNGHPPPSALQALGGGEDA
jgi:Lon protease-like protein